MKKVIRVLHIINGMGSGGAEMVIMNWYRHIDREKVQFDFLLRTKNNIYTNEIKELGGRIYYMPSFPKNALQNYVETNKFLRSHLEYSIIHVHGNALIYMIALEIGKKTNIPCRIMHSHNTKAASKIYAIIHYINKLRIKNLATDYLACSEAAGKWMFGSIEFSTIKNAIEINKFKFNKKIRNSYREKLNIVNKLVIGNVARFLPSKNHKFLLEVFYEIQKKNENSVLLLIGEGETQPEIRKKVNELKINNKVIFLGRRSDVNCLMQAMDVFIFPSFFEGLGITLIEAQSSGLPCIASDVIPKESKVTNDIKYISLKSSAKYWADKALQFVQKERRDNSMEIQKTGYDIESVTLTMQKFYLKKYKERDKL